MADMMSEPERQQLRHSAQVVDGFIAEEPAADLADELLEGRPRYSYTPFVNREVLEARGAPQRSGWEQQVRFLLAGARTARACMCARVCVERVQCARRAWRGEIEQYALPAKRRDGSGKRKTTLDSV